MSISVTDGASEAARAELRLPANVSAPALARRTVRDLLGSLPSPLQSQLSLVASELVTNVLLHCRAENSSPTLTLALAPERVTLEVADAGTGFDPAKLPESDEVGGWGLQVLDAVADRWWVERDGGTRVICEIDR
ncbi:MAG TPA: ATP-binding protein [Solirubrobacteraceae bacterium]|jgi:anti-sigma regulatory factor (Ser/Thr protein kinase)|nr:ATP-binding protein [Solirubrobacteraceae bacterium]